MLFRRSNFIHQVPAYSGPVGRKKRGNASQRRLDQQIIRFTQVNASEFFWKKEK
jgi:hypothetical protein